MAQSTQVDTYHKVIKEILAQTDTVFQAFKKALSTNLLPPTTVIGGGCGSCGTGWGRKGQNTGGRDGGRNLGSTYQSTSNWPVSTIKTTKVLKQKWTLFLDRRGLYPITPHQRQCQKESNQAYQFGISVTIWHQERAPKTRSSQSGHANANFICELANARRPKYKKLKNVW